jgi:hypothetical protein
MFEEDIWTEERRGDGRMEKIALPIDLPTRSATTASASLHTQTTGLVHRIEFIFELLQINFDILQRTVVPCL